MDRTERQKECIKKWLKAGGRASIVACTGFGKTRIAINTIERLLKSNDHASILIVVPTEILKDQWTDQLIERNLYNNCHVEIINSVIKKEWTCDLLIIDEVHICGSLQFSQVFGTVQYKLLMCLTGTLERLDGKEQLIKQYAPVCDLISIQEAEENGWTSPIKEYLVLLDVDLTEYNELNKNFNGFFSFFGWDFNLAMKCATNSIARNKYAKYLKVSPKIVAANAFGFMTTMRKRKEFVMSHPKKVEVCKKILNARKNKKCITFSATIKDSEKIGIGLVMHSKQSKKKNTEILDQFNSQKTGVLNTSKAADCGVDVKGLSVGVILATDSSKIRKTQRIGRVIRFETGKVAEMFTLVIKGTQEVGWFDNASTSKVITIDEKQLDRVLCGESIETRERNKISTHEFRY